MLLAQNPPLGYTAVSPVIYRESGFTFWFYSDERGHAPHVHVRKSGQVASIWVGDGAIKQTGTMRDADLREAQRIVNASASGMMESWRYYHEKD